MGALVTTAELADRLEEPDRVLLDASWFGTFPGQLLRNPQAEFAQAHLPGARFLDVEAVSKSSGVGDDEAVASLLGAAGVREGARVTLYDNSGYRTAARAWWLLKRHGVAASLLDGGLPKWRAEGRPIESGEVQAAAAELPALRRDRRAMRTLSDMLSNLDTQAEQVLDARSAARFSGAELDPRGLPSGHVPGSLNLPYAELFDVDGTWKRGDALRAAFEGAGVDLDRPVVTTCGSGVTAAVLAFGLHLLGREAALYDGSWSEWAANPETPKATVAL